MCLSRDKVKIMSHSLDQKLALPLVDCGDSNEEFSSLCFFFFFFSCVQLICCKLCQTQA